MEESFEFIRVSERSHEQRILDGKFISNNLLIYLTEHGVEVSNVNSELTVLNKINFAKFGYI